jgi:hypothetical protein
MKQNLVVASLAVMSMVVVPGTSFAQNVNITRSTVETLPYTLIYPAEMEASGADAGAITINHPDAPLQCQLNVVPVEDTGWSADGALSSLDPEDVNESWSTDFAGFTLGQTGTVAYQDVTALTYEGTSIGSPQGVPLTIVHTEAVSGGAGYVLDCFYATEVAERARQLVDFIIMNFSTRPDAECCIGVEEQPADTSNSG